MYGTYFTESQMNHQNLNLSILANVYIKGNERRMLSYLKAFTAIAN